MRGQHRVPELFLGALAGSVGLDRETRALQLRSQDRLGVDQDRPVLGRHQVLPVQVGPAERVHHGQQHPGSAEEAGRSVRVSAGCSFRVLLPPVAGPHQHPERTHLVDRVAGSQPEEEVVGCRLGLQVARLVDHPGAVGESEHVDGTAAVMGV